MSVTAVRAVLGVRYGRAPRRFAPVEPEDGSTGATALADVPIFPQLPSRLALAMGDAPSDNPQDEQAFLLNVWSPEGADGLPVLVFLHGGAWVSGGGSLRWYDGARLAGEGVVAVTVNYRIGALGHLSDEGAEPVCLPLGDVLAALRWVSERIAEHGGDPDRVTVVGQSAGGWYAHALSVMPEARGLLARVALLSIGSSAPWSIAQQRSFTAGVRERLRALSTTPADASIGHLLEAGRAVLGGMRRGFAEIAPSYLPVDAPPVPPGLFDRPSAAACHAEASYIRYTADEDGIFFFGGPERVASRESVLAWLASSASGADPGSRSAPRGAEYETVRSVTSWRDFGAFSTALADDYVSAGIDTVLRRFMLPSPLEGLGAAHCFDLPFQFGNRDAWHDAPMLAGLPDALFEAVATQTVSDLVLFAKGGLDRPHVVGRDAVEIGVCR